MVCVLVASEPQNTMVLECQDMMSLDIRDYHAQSHSLPVFPGPHLLVGYKSATVSICFASSLVTQI